MSNPKPNRIRDQDLLDRVKELPCFACLSLDPPKETYPSDPDHITTRGAGGEDVPENVWPLCRPHHTQRHAKGLVWMVQRYGMLQLWLQKAERYDILERAGVEWIRGEREGSIEGQG